MKMRRKYRHEIYITDVETFEWYLIIYELNERNVPVKTMIVKIPIMDAKFKIYPYLLN